VEVFDKNRKLTPTELGKTLYKCYNSVDPELVAPELRGNMERLISRIETGEKDYDEVLKEMIDIFREKFIHFRKNIELLDKELGKKFKVNKCLK
jgi:DNA topoisomerase IA